MAPERRAARARRAFGRAARLACPRCGAGPMFHGWFRMARACSMCGLSFERAQGYFVGAIYVNYAVTSLVVIGGYLLLWAFTELTTATQLALWLPVVVVFPLWFFRYSRSFWLALEYAANPEP
jgi:uncharacterized protein (DUF983 family)